jgi:hypothetical protein
LSATGRSKKGKLSSFVQQENTTKPIVIPFGRAAAGTSVGIGLRGLMTLTVVALIVGVLAIGLIVLLICKSTLSMHRDNQLFLDDVSSHMHSDARVQRRVWGVSTSARGDAGQPEG